MCMYLFWYSGIRVIIIVNYVQFFCLKFSLNMLYHPLNIPFCNNPRYNHSKKNKFL